jgi:hypothetical protein
MLIFLLSAALVLVLQWLVISFAAVRAFDSSLLAAVRILAGQMRRWVNRCQRAVDRVSVIHSPNEEFHRFAVACAFTRVELEKIITASPLPEYANIVVIGEMLQAAIANLREAEIAFVKALRRIRPTVEQAGHGLSETENIRARINATWNDYTALREQRECAARRIPGSA